MYVKRESFCGKGGGGIEKVFGGAGGLIFNAEAQRRGDASH